MPHELGSQTHTAKTPNPAYEAFLAKIYDRSFDLGECFKNCIEFLEFSDGCMSLASSAAGDDQKRLREGSKVILQILRSLFGESAKIKITPKQSPEVGASEQKDAVNLDDERGGAVKSEADEATPNQAGSKFDSDGVQESLSQNDQAQEPELSNLTGNLFSGSSEERTRRARPATRGCPGPAGSCSPWGSPSRRRARPCAAPWGARRRRPTSSAT